MSKSYRENDLKRGREIKQIINANSKEIDTSFILEESVYILDVSTRCLNCLKINFNTIGELILMPMHEFLKFRNFGKGSMLELKNELANFKLELQNNPKPFIPVDLNTDVKAINTILPNLEQRHEKLIKKAKRKGIKKGIKQKRREVVENLIKAARFRENEIAAFAGVPVSFVVKVRAKIESK